MTATVTRNAKYQYGNQDRSRLVAQNSANTIKEDVFDVTYKDTTTDIDVGNVVATAGVVTVDISGVARVFNNILSVEIISQDYVNGFVSCLIPVGRATPDTIEFKHFLTFGKPAVAADPNANPVIIAADAVAPTTPAKGATLTDATYTCVIRGY